MTINPREIYSFFASKGFLERLQVPEPEDKRRSTTPRREEPTPRKKKAKKRSLEGSLEDEPKKVPPMPLFQILLMCTGIVLILGTGMVGKRSYMLAFIILAGLFVGLLFKRYFYPRGK